MSRNDLEPDEFVEMFQELIDNFGQSVVLNAVADAVEYHGDGKTAGAIREASLAAEEENDG